MAPRSDISVRSSSPASTDSSPAPSSPSTGSNGPILWRWFCLVLKRPDDHLTKVIYQFDLSFANWRRPLGSSHSCRKEVVLQQTNLTEEDVPSLCQRPWELEGPGSSYGLNAFIAWDSFNRVLTSHGSQDMLYSSVSQIVRWAIRVKWIFLRIIFQNGINTSWNLF